MKKLLLTILLMLLIGCKTVPMVQEFPTLESVRPVKPILDPVSTTGDLLKNYNIVVGYSLQQDAYIDEVETYLKDIIKAP